ncbi:MAG: hypothetical protein NZ959_06590, partial [Armatimonadetes bacterium]|nr:hypothetical protein [Armatimonadota bacterium]
PNRQLLSLLLESTITVSGYPTENLKQIMMSRKSLSFPIWDPRLLIGWMAVCLLIALSAEPLFWLPVLSLCLLLISFLKEPTKRAPTQSPIHPVATLPFGTGKDLLWNRWVTFKKVIGGDSLSLIPTTNGAMIALLDLSKNDLETLIHFLWVRSLLSGAKGSLKKELITELERLTRFVKRVDMAYLIGDFSGREVEWHSSGPFILAWKRGKLAKVWVVPQMSRRHWRTRTAVDQWLMATDGLLPHLEDLRKVLEAGYPVEEWIRDLRTADDLTVCWLNSAIQLSPCKQIGNQCLREAMTGNEKPGNSESRSPLLEEGPTRFSSW